MNKKESYLLGDTRELNNLIQLMFETEVDYLIQNTEFRRPVIMLPVDESMEDPNVAGITLVKTEKNKYIAFTVGIFDYYSHDDRNGNITWLIINDCEVITKSRDWKWECVRSIQESIIEEYRYPNIYAIITSFIKEFSSHEEREIRKLLRKVFNLKLRELPSGKFKVSSVSNDPTDFEILSEAIIVPGNCFWGFKKQV